MLFSYLKSKYKGVTYLYRLTLLIVVYTVCLLTIIYFLVSRDCTCDIPASRVDDILNLYIKGDDK